MLAGTQKMIDLAKNPRTTLCCTTDHDRIGTGFFQDEGGFFGRVDIAIRNDGNTYCRLDCGDGVVLSLAAVAIRACSAM